MNNPDASLFFTFIINHRSDKDILFKNIHKSTRSEIRSGLKHDSLVTIFDNAPSTSDWLEISDLYNTFAINKGISKANIKKLKLFANGKVITLAKVVDIDRQLLSGAQIYVRDSI